MKIMKLLEYFIEKLKIGIDLKNIIWRFRPYIKENSYRSGNISELI